MVVAVAGHGARRLETVSIATVTVHPVTMVMVVVVVIVWVVRVGVGVGGVSVEVCLGLYLCTATGGHPVLPQTLLGERGGGSWREGGGGGGRLIIPPLRGCGYTLHAPPPEGAWLHEATRI